MSKECQKCGQDPCKCNKDPDNVSLWLLIAFISALVLYATQCT